MSQTTHPVNALPNDGSIARSSTVGFSIYAAIVGASLLVILNPIVASLAIVVAIPHIAYLSTLDLCLAAIIATAILHIRTRNIRFFWLMLAGMGMTPLIMVAAEIAISYAELRYQPAWHGRNISGVYEPDPRLAWRLMPNGSGREVYPGEFDVTYLTDAQGRRTLPDARVAHPTVHVFGSSFTFGQGVRNDQVALYILAQIYRDHFRVLNYSVDGYGLDQMVLDLELNRDSIAPGDVVMLAPTPLSVSWSLIENSFPCLFTIRTGQVPLGRYPFLTKDGWQFVDLERACGFIDTTLMNSPLPVGNLLRRYRAATTWSATIAHADLLFSHAQRLVEERRARLLPLMVVNVDECRMKRFEFDLSALKSPIVSMMPYCPADDVRLETLRFPTDGHYNAEGNRWLADVLAKVLLKFEPTLGEPNPDGQTGPISAQ